MTDRELILDVLARAGLARFAPRVEALMKPAIVAMACDGDAGMLGASRFGGEPDLPAGTAWPHAWDVPMEFVAQVRLPDVAAHDVDGILPTDGTLLFFYNSQWTSSFNERDDRPFECGKVIYARADEVLVRTAAPRVEFENEYGKRDVPTVYTAAPLRFAPTITVPDGGAFLDGADLAELRAVWEDFLFNHDRELPPALHTSASRLLGHLGQHDDTGVMSKEDVLLFQIDSHPRVGFDWGKRYFLYFIAAASDIRSGDFSRVRVEHDISC